MTLRERALAFAESWLSVREQPRGSNRGPMVDQFNVEAGASLGSPWCCSFAFSCFCHAAMHAEVEVPILRTTSCSALFRWANDQGRLTRTPRPGDIGLLKGGPTGHHHAVLVTTALPLGWVGTIEGNTTLITGSPEGYGTFKRIRRMATLDFVDTVPAEDGKPAVGAV